jgi:hypothetical protein
MGVSMRKHYIYWVFILCLIPAQAFSAARSSAKKGLPSSLGTAAQSLKSSYEKSIAATQEAITSLRSNKSLQQFITTRNHLEKAKEALSKAHNHFSTHSTTGTLVGILSADYFESEEATIGNIEKTYNTLLAAFITALQEKLVKQKADTDTESTEKQRIRLTLRKLQDDADGIKTTHEKEKKSIEEIRKKLEIDLEIERTTRKRVESELAQLQQIMVSEKQKNERERAIALAHMAELEKARHQERDTLRIKERELTRSLETARADLQKSVHIADARLQKEKAEAMERIRVEKELLAKEYAHRSTQQSERASTALKEEQTKTKQLADDIGRLHKEIEATKKEADKTSQALLEQAHKERAIHTSKITQLHKEYETKKTQEVLAREAEDKKRADALLQQQKMMTDEFSVRQQKLKQEYEQQLIKHEAMAKEKTGEAEQRYQEQLKKQEELHTALLNNLIEQQKQERSELLQEISRVRAETTEQTHITKKLLDSTRATLLAEAEAKRAAYERELALKSQDVLEKQQREFETQQKELEVVVERERTKFETQQKEYEHKEQELTTKHAHVITEMSKERAHYEQLKEADARDRARIQKETTDQMQSLKDAHTLEIETLKKQLCDEQQARTELQETHRKDTSRLEEMYRKNLRIEQQKRAILKKQKQDLEKENQDMVTLIDSAREEALEQINKEQQRKKLKEHAALLRREKEKAEEADRIKRAERALHQQSNRDIITWRTMGWRSQFCE